MKHLIGMESNAFVGDNEFSIDFEKYKELGIDALDYQGLAIVNNVFYLSKDEFNDYFVRLHNELEKYDLKIVQLHALWDPIYEFKHRDEDMFPYYEKAIIAASILKASYVVMHPVPLKGHYLWEKVDYKEIISVNKEFIKRLIPIAKKHNVYIAIENLPFLELEELFSPSGTLNFVLDMKDENVVMCLDTGHFNMFKEDNIYEFLLKGKYKIRCLHIHDNNGLTDSHSIPYMGTFDWKMFLKGLKEINFDGVLSLETKIPTIGLSNGAYQLLNNGLITILKDFRNELDD